MLRAARRATRGALNARARPGHRRRSATHAARCPGRARRDRGPSRLPPTCHHPLLPAISGMAVLRSWCRVTVSIWVIITPMQIQRKGNLGSVLNVCCWAGGAHVPLFGMCAATERPARPEPDEGRKTVDTRTGFPLPRVAHTCRCLACVRPLNAQRERDRTRAGKRYKAGGEAVGSMW